MLYRGAMSLERQRDYMVNMNVLNTVILGENSMGSPSHLFCIQCGAANPLHARFCPVCGHALSADDTGTRWWRANPPDG